MPLVQIGFVLEAISIAVQAVVVFFLLRTSSFRRYPLLLVYCVLQLAATISEEYVSRVLQNVNLYVRLYWTDELILDLLLFLMVIALTYRALEGKPLRAAMGRFLGAVFVIVLIVPFVLFSARRFSNLWFDSTSQLINFGAAILNLGLWTALIATKKRDPLLLKVSAGLGIAVTGAAIAFGLRRFAPPGGTLQHSANVFKTLTYLASVSIWCWAFRPAARKSRTPPAAIGTSTFPL